MMNKLLYSLTIIVLLVTACSGQAATATPKPSPTPQPTDTHPPPTTTPVPPTATSRPAPTEPPATATAPPTVTMSSTPAPTAVPTEIPVERISHVAYVDEDDDSRKLDIYLPVDQDGPFPTILAIPRVRQTRTAWGDYGRHFARQGYAMLVISRPKSISDYSYPSYVEDAFCALAWLHANADLYGFDGTHVFVTGFWSGGSEAALIGTVDSPADYLVDCPHALPETNWVHGTMMIGGTFDYTHESFRGGADMSVPKRFGGSYEEAKEMWEAGSAVTWADSDDPPLLYVCGDDTQSTVDVWGDTMSNLMTDIEPMIKQTDIDATVVLLPDLDVYSFVDEQIYAAMEEFLRQHQD